MFREPGGPGVRTIRVQCDREIVLANARLAKHPFGKHKLRHCVGMEEGWMVVLSRSDESPGSGGHMCMEWDLGACRYRSYLIVSHTTQPHKRFVQHIR